MSQISIIVPMYNVAPFIVRCIESVIAQSFNDFELILVDDGSNDDCGVICEEFLLKDCRITVIHKKNGGLSDARNYGIEYAFSCCCSQWIAFLDSDDWVHYQMYDLLLQSVRRDNTLLSVCLHDKTDGKSEMHLVHNGVSTKIDGIELFTSDYHVDATVAWNKLYNKELFREIRFPFGKIHEDEFVTYKLLYRAGVVSFLNEKLYYYFQNNNGITKSGYSIKRLNQLEAVFKQRNFFHKLRKFDEEKKWDFDILISLVYLHIPQLRLLKDKKNVSRLKFMGRCLMIKIIFLYGADFFIYEDAYTLFFPAYTRIKNAIYALKMNIVEKGFSGLIGYFFRKRH